jgi:hypothetical protein
MTSTTIPKGGISIIPSAAAIIGLEAIYVTIIASSIVIGWKKYTISSSHRIVVIPTLEGGRDGASPIPSRARVVHGTLAGN